MTNTGSSDGTISRPKTTNFPGKQNVDLRWRTVLVFLRQRKWATPQHRSHTHTQNLPKFQEPNKLINTCSSSPLASSSMFLLVLSKHGNNRSLIPKIPLPAATTVSKAVRLHGGPSILFKDGRRLDKGNMRSLVTSYFRRSSNALGFSQEL